MNDYNLLDEKWIPVLYHDGVVKQVGILKALEDADRIRRIAASNPMDRLAILRFLLAILYWCKGNPGSGTGLPLQEIRAKLIANKESFDLLARKRPFYQDDQTEGINVSATNLLFDLPSGSSIAHFRHTSDYRDGLCLGCCAMGLIRWSVAAQAGTAGAGQSMTAGINGTTPTYSIPTGNTLLATLTQAWPIAKPERGDLPIWAGGKETSPPGILKAMTWRSRRILLAPLGTDGNRDFSTGRCCHCGAETDRLVRSILFRPGWKRPFNGPWQDDPHLLRITRKGKSAKAKEKSIIPSWPGPNDPLENHTGVWRSIVEGLLQRSPDSDSRRTEFETILLANVQALYKHVGEHWVILPALAADARQRLLAELRWLREITWVTTAARGANWRDPPRGHCLVGRICAPRAKGHAMRSSLCAASIAVERDLEEAFRRLVDGEATVKNWRDEVCAVLRNHASHIIEAAKPGSPLRRLEARQLALDVIEEAASQNSQRKGGTP